jgi:hypothetical protein
VLGESGVQYDIDKFIYLGAGSSQTNYVFYTRSQLGLNSIEKLRAASGIRVGGQTVGHSIYFVGRLFAWLMDLKQPRFIPGYSGPDLDAALLQGEIDARASVPMTSRAAANGWKRVWFIGRHYLKSPAATAFPTRPSVKSPRWIPLRGPIAAGRFSSWRGTSG